MDTLECQQKSYCLLLLLLLFTLCLKQFLDSSSVVVSLKGHLPFANI